MATLNGDAVRELEALAGSAVQVFVDSGAFSEVEFTAAGPVVARPITLAAWGSTSSVKSS